MRTLSESTISIINKLVDLYWSQGISHEYKIIEQISFWLILYNNELHLEKSSDLQEHVEKLKKNKEELHNLKEYVTKKLPDLLRLIGLDKGDLIISDRISEIIDLLYELEQKIQQKDLKYGNVIGYLIETLLNKSDVGPLGQFITPRSVIRSIIAMIDPDSNKKLCDPACGTGGFLVGTGDYIWDKENEKSLNLFGYDLDETMTRLSKIYLFLSGVDKPNIVQIDSLSNALNEENSFDFVVSNPPYSVNVQQSTLYEDFDQNITSSELLFIHLGLRLLVPKGQMAVIVPDGVLQNESNHYIALRKLLIEEHRIDGVISLPRINNGIKTSVLIVTKGDNNTANNRGDLIWFYELSSYPTGTNEIITDLVTNWKKRNEDRLKWASYSPLSQKGTTQITYPPTWPDSNITFVNKDFVVKNQFSLAIGKYKPLADKLREQVIGQSPETIINKLIDLEQEISGDLQKLLRQLKSNITSQIRYSVQVPAEEKTKVTTINPKNDKVIPPIFDSFIGLLHPIQQRFLNVFYEKEYPLAGHEARKYLDDSDKAQFGVQEAKQTIELLESVGLLEKAPQLLMHYPSTRISKPVLAGDEEVVITRWNIPPME